MYAPVVSKCFQTKKAPKPLPFGAAHTYMAYIREYPIPGKKEKNIFRACFPKIRESRFSI